MQDEQLSNSIVKLQSDQFIIHPVEGAQTVSSGSRPFEVDLSRQSCECEEFQSCRKSFPIGDPRRFCAHLVQARCERTDDLHPFLRSLLDAQEANKKGLPNGSSYAFFEVDGRLSFYGENRDQTAYFFLTEEGGLLFREYYYNRKKRRWSGDVPASPEQLLVFAFKERGQYVTSTKSQTRTKAKKRRRTRAKNPSRRETPSLLKYLLLLVVAASLIVGGVSLYPFLAGVNNKELADNESKTKMQDNLQVKKKEHPQTLTEEEVSSNEENDVQPQSEETDNLEQGSEISSETEPSPDEKNSSSTMTEKKVEFRQWEVVDEQSIFSARYKSYQSGKVVLEREDNGEKVKIDQTRLRPLDQEYIKKIRRERRLQRAREASEERRRLQSPDSDNPDNSSSELQPTTKR